MTVTTRARKIPFIFIVEAGWQYGYESEYE